MLGGTAALGFSAAFLAACGGDDDSGSTSAATGGASGGSAANGNSSLITEAEDTSSAAVKGGTLTLALTSGIKDFGIQVASAQTVDAFGNAMGKLFSLRPGHLQLPDGSMDGEMAESIEYSPDGLSATVKLRPNLKWHPIAPVNGRDVEVDDINRSWEILNDPVTTFRPEILNQIGPLGPVAGLEVPDARTMVFKLAFPYRLEPLFAMAVAGGFFLVPKEYNDGFDSRNTMIGTGPFYRSEFEPSSRVVYKKFDGYWDAQKTPYVDEIQEPIIMEQATRLAQFETGAILGQTSGSRSVPTQEEILGVVKQPQKHPALQG